MRWKALKFLGRLESSEKETFGFRSRKCPPVVDELTNFELGLTEKYIILNALGDCRLLDKKSEFVNKCRHENKLLLSNIKDSKD